MPTAVTDGVVERGADGAARCLQLRATVNERAGDLDVVSARCPVQRGLRAAAPTIVVWVSSRLEQQRDRGRSSWKVTRPISGSVQWRTPPTLGTLAPDHADRGEFGSVGEEAPEGAQVATMDRQDQFGRHRIRMRQGQLGSPRSERVPHRHAARLGLRTISLSPGGSTWVISEVNTRLDSPTRRVIRHLSPRDSSRSARSRCAPADRRRGCPRRPFEGVEVALAPDGDHVGVALAVGSRASRR